MDLAIFILVASPFMAFACYMLWMGVSAKRKAARAKAWPKLEGRVVDSKVRQEIRHSANGDRFYYIPQVIYEYQVQGSMIRGSRIHLNYAEGVSEKSAKELVAQYPVGSSIQVYYNPQNPKEAIIAHANVSLKLALGIFIFVLLLLGFIFWADYAGGCRKV